MKLFSKMLPFVFVVSSAYAEKGDFGVEVDVSTKGLFPPKLESVTVASVEENSSDARAGIVIGDLVVSINGCLIPGCSAFKARKEMKKDVGESLDLVVVKSDGQRVGLSLVAE